MKVAPTLVALVNIAAAPALLFGLTALPTPKLQLAAGVALAALVLLGAFLLLRGGVGALAFAALVVAGFLLPMNNLRLTAWATYSDAFLVLAFGLAVLQPRLALRRITLPRTCAAGLLIFFVGGLLGSAFGGQPLVGLVNFARLLITIVASVLAPLLWQPTQRAVRTVGLAWLAGNAVSVAVGVQVGPTVEFNRPSGLTTHPNALGLICVLSIVFALFIIAAAEHRWEQLVAFGSIGIACLGAVISGSRAALVAVAVVLVARVALGRNWKVAAWSTVAGALVVLLGSGYLSTLDSTNALVRLFQPDSTVGSSDTDRLGRIRAALRLFEERPLAGQGFADATDAHNVLLQILVAAGLIGLVGFVVLCLPMMTGALRPELGAWRWLALMPVAYLTDGMFSNNLWDRYLWLPMGLGLYVGTLVRSRADVPDRELEPA